MKGDDTKKARPSSEEQLAALAAMPDDQIDYSDIPPLADEFWTNAVRGKFYRPVKQHLSVRIDADVVDWLKKNATGDKRGYQSRMNQILRTAMIESMKTKASASK